MLYCHKITKPNSRFELNFVIFHCSERTDILSSDVGSDVGPAASVVLVVGLRHTFFSEAFTPISEFLEIL